MIPVVGKDLLQIEMLGRAVKVDSYLAGELARAFGFTPEELPFSPDLADVICSKPELCAKLVKNAQAIYSKVASVYETKIKKNPNFPVPCALQKLAEIPRFSFFLSLTCDDLLHQALESARGQPPVRIDNERKGTPDITEEQLKSGRPVVYRLFGRFAHWGDYALTEEDMLEFMHWLPERAYRPEKLFNFFERFPFYILHRVKVTPAGFAQMEDRGNIRVTNARRCACFTQKTKPCRFISEVSLTDDFQRHWQCRSMSNAL